MGVDSPPLRNLVGGLGIIAVLLAFAVGLPALNKQLPGERPLSAGVPYQVGGAVEIVPPPGSTLDIGLSRAYATSGVAFFLADRDRLKIGVSVRTYEGSLDDATQQAHYLLVHSDKVHPVGDRIVIRTSGGVNGREGAFTGDDQAVARAGPSRRGRYAVFVNDGRSVLVTPLGPTDRLAVDAFDID